MPQAGGYHFRIWFLLAFCLTVMISPVLCLLEVLHLILSLSRENLFMEWAATMASLQNESLIAGSAASCPWCPPLDFHGKWP